MQSRSGNLFSISAPIALAAFGLFALGMPAIAQAPPPPPSASATANNPQPHLRYRIVVDQGKWEQIRTEQWSLPPDVRNGIQSQLLDKLQKSGYFIVMEREQGAMQQMNQEDQIAANKQNSLGQTGVRTANREQRTAANYIITPSVIGFKQDEGQGGSISLGSIRLGGARTSAEVTLNVRISDAQTSEIIETQTTKGSCDSSAVGIKVRVLGGGFNLSQFKSSPAGKAVDKALDAAIDKIIVRLSQEPWTALVAAQDASSGDVIINAGDLSGVRPGMEFDVFHVGQPVRDPDSGDIISKGSEKKIGRIKITQVEKNAAHADVLWGKTFRVRDLVRAVN
jgi:curli biogenesis system outer membrane secretion channel CsgG